MHEGNPIENLHNPAGLLLLHEPVICKSFDVLESFVGKVMYIQKDEVFPRDEIEKHEGTKDREEREKLFSFRDRPLVRRRKKWNKKGA